MVEEPGLRRRRDAVGLAWDSDAVVGMKVGRKAEDERAIDDRAEERSPWSISGAHTCQPFGQAPPVTSAVTSALFTAPPKAMAAPC